MRRLRRSLLTAVVAGLGLAGLFVPGAEAADGTAVLTSFSVSSATVDTTTADVPVTVSVSVLDPAGIRSIEVSGSTTTPGFPYGAGFSQRVFVDRTTSWSGQIQVPVPAGFARTWDVAVAVSTDVPGGVITDLTPQIDAKGLNRHFASRVTAAPRALADVKVEKRWDVISAPGNGPLFAYNTYVRWKVPTVGPKGVYVVTTGNSGCGKFYDFYWLRASDSSRANNASVVVPCTSQSRLFNDFGPSPVVKAVG